MDRTSKWSNPRSQRDVMPSGRRREHAQCITSLKIYFRPRLKAVASRILKSLLLDFLVRDFPQYAWSLRTLDRRLREFDIHFSDTRISFEEVKEAIKNELDGPGCLLGYRAMQNMLRQEYKLNVPRDLVHDVLFDLDPDGLAARCPAKS